MTKKNAPLLIAGIFLVLLGCKQKKDSFIPFSSIIKGEINHIDTSLYSIIKITYIDTSKTDTAYIRREEVRGLAQDFLVLPQLSQRKYTEESIPGPLRNQSTLTYRAIHPDKEEIKQVDLIIDLTVDASSKKSQIQTIIIDRMFTNKDSSVEKKLLWQVDKSFLVTTIIQKPGQPENISTYKVIWNDDEEE